MSFIVGSHDFDLYQLRFKVYFTFFGKSLKNFWKAVEFFEADNLKQNQSVTFKKWSTEKIQFWLGSNITRQSQDSTLRRLGKNLPLSFPVPYITSVTVLSASPPLCPPTLKMDTAILRHNLISSV